MPGFMLFIVIVVVVLLLLKSVHDAQQAKASGAPPVAPAERPARPRPRPRPRRKAPPVDEAKLADHVTKLREAVDGGLITTDEAVASIVRFTEGACSEDAARQMLHHRDAA